MPQKSMLGGSLRAIAGALREGVTSATAMAEEAIANHAAHCESLNAHTTWDPEKTRALAAAADQARTAGADLGPLQGIPVSVKDLYGLSGWPIYAGSPKRLPTRWERDGPVVAALRQQLAVFTGKTTTVEFAVGTLGVNPHWGTPHNPWDADRHRVPGGSSGGAGVSLWEGSALLALGTDTAGSVRAPASMTATVGLKTSLGRWSTDGIVPLSPHLDTAGVLTRSVADLAYAFPAIDPEGQRAPSAMTDRLEQCDIAGIRLGICDAFFWDDCDPGVAEGAEAAVQELVDAGARTRTVAIPQAPELYEMQQVGSFAAPDFAAFIHRELPDWLDTMDPGVRLRVDGARSMLAHEYLDRLHRKRTLAAAATANFNDVDALLCPTIPNTPPALDDLADPASFREATILALRNTSMANLLDHCAITLPVALDAVGMPVGLQLMAPLGADAQLIAVALALERVLGDASQRLPMPPMLQ